MFTDLCASNHHYVAENPRLDMPMTSRVLHESRCGPWSWEAEKSTDGWTDPISRPSAWSILRGCGWNDIQDGETVYVCATLFIYPVTGSRVPVGSSRGEGDAYISARTRIYCEPGRAKHSTDDNVFVYVLYNTRGMVGVIFEPRWSATPLVINSNHNNNEDNCRISPVLQLMFNNYQFVN